MKSVFTLLVISLLLVFPIEFAIFGFALHLYNGIDLMGYANLLFEHWAVSISVLFVGLLARAFYIVK